MLLSKAGDATPGEGIAFTGWNGSVHAEFVEDIDRVRELTRGIPESADIHEPLERVAEALFETLRGGAAA
jgi:hypothetical protein